MIFSFTACAARQGRGAEPGGVPNTAEIEGYLDADRYYPDALVTLYVHTLAESFAYSLVRMGAHEEPLAVVEHVPGQRQDYRADSYRNGAQWRETTHFHLPAGLVSGLYAFKLVTEIDGRYGNPYFIPFVVKGRKGPGMPALVVMSNTFTWQAYNGWGGGSFYRGSPRDPEDSLETMVSLRRPCASACHDSPVGHTGCVEKHLAAFLEGNGYPYHQITNLDLHEDPDALTGYRILVIHTHSEYWTAEMIDHLEAFLRAGGRVLNLSGNVLWWKVTLRGAQLECQKFRGRHEQTGEPGGKWLDLGRPSDPLLGLRSSPKGIHTFAPLRVLAAEHWLFQGAGLRNGDLIGGKGLNRGGASGWETDKLGPLAPAGTVLLARGLNPGAGGADVVYFETSAGGAVLSAGGITVPGSLLLDADLQILVRNFLERWQGRVTPTGNPLP